MTTTENKEAATSIALKFWWGWVPHTKEKKWQVPGQQARKAMTKDEIEWFKQH